MQEKNCPVLAELGYHRRMRRWFGLCLVLACVAGICGCSLYVVGGKTPVTPTAIYRTPTRRPTVTPSATPTRTATPPPLPTTPPVWSEGSEIQLQYAVCYDLDSGQVRDQLNDPTCDVVFISMPLGQADTAAVIPVPPAAFAFEASMLMRPDPTQCQSDLPYWGQAEARAPRPSEAICYQTGEGRFGWLALNTTSEKGVTFDFRTFTAQEGLRIPRSEGMAAVFMGETVLDGTHVEAGAEFVKSWRLMNSGSKRWTTAFHLVYQSGDAMGETLSVPLPRDVLPGGEIDLTVRQKAPEQTGPAIGYWMLESDQGERFGLGSFSNEPFYVWIEVVPPGTLLPTPSSSLEGNAGVMAAALTVSPVYYEGVCPVTLSFNGKLWARGKGEYTYQLLAASTKPEYFNFHLPAPDVAENLKDEQSLVEVSYQLEIGSSVSGWAQLAGLGNAGGVFSEKVPFQVRCAP